MEFEITTTSAEQTIEIGRKIGGLLKGGEIVGISGQLGTGKTHLIKGIASGAGAEDYKNVNSPTFVIVNEYIGNFEIFHIDAYRLNSVEEFESIGFDDFCHPESIVLIEWVDRIEEALRKINYIQIKLLHQGGSNRKILITDAPNYLDLIKPAQNI